MEEKMFEFEKKLREETQLRRLSEVTYKTYFYRLRRFYNYFKKPLSDITSQEMREYFLYLINVKKSGRESIRNCYCALKFYYTNCLGYEDFKIKSIKLTCRPKVPVIISRQEVRRILEKVTIYDYKICLKLIYACGLRIGEVVSIKISDIDGQRNILTIRSGKGNRDRTVPISDNILKNLREYWKTHRNSELLFPKKNFKYKIFDRSKTQESITKRTIEVAMKSAVKEAGINKRVTPHTLRHCYATHLLEAGANINAISLFLGHHTLRSTMIYLHLTNDAEAESCNIMCNIMGDL